MVGGVVEEVVVCGVVGGCEDATDDVRGMYADERVNMDDRVMLRELVGDAVGCRGVGFEEEKGVLVRLKAGT